MTSKLADVVDLLSDATAAFLRVDQDQERKPNLKGDNCAKMVDADDKKCMAEIKEFTSVEVTSTPDCISEEKLGFVSADQENIRPSCIPRTDQVGPVKCRIDYV